jgi:hypothetical protein
VPSPVGCAVHAVKLLRLQNAPVPPKQTSNNCNYCKRLCFAPSRNHAAVDQPERAKPDKGIYTWREYPKEVLLGDVLLLDYGGYGKGDGSLHTLLDNRGTPFHPHFIMAVEHPLNKDSWIPSKPEELCSHL